MLAGRQAVFFLLLPQNFDCGGLCQNLFFEPPKMSQNLAPYNKHRPKLASFVLVVPCESSCRYRHMWDKVSVGKY